MQNQKTNSKIKKLFCAITIAAIFLLCFVVFFITDEGSVVFASDTEKQLSDSVTDGIGKLDLKDFDKFLKNLLQEQQDALGFSSVKDILQKIAQGQSGNFFGVFLTEISKSCGKYFLGFVPLLISVVIIVILQSILDGMTSNFKKQTTGEIVHFVCYATIIVLLFAGVTSILVETTKTINSLATFSSIIFPILLTLLAAVGGASTVAVLTPLMAALSNIIIQIINYIVLPAFIATIVFSVVGNISKNVKLDKLTKLFKSGAGWVLTIVFGLFMAIATTQGFVASSFDGVGFSAAKFALSSYVPILGGYLSDGFDLVAASVVIIKNAFGFVAILTLITVILFPILKLVVFMLSLKLMSAIVEPLGNERVTSLMNSLSKNISLLISAIAGVGFMFFVILLMVLGSCNMAIR